MKHTESAVAYEGGVEDNIVEWLIFDQINQCLCNELSS